MGSAQLYLKGFPWSLSRFFDCRTFFNQNSTHVIPVAVPKGTTLNTSGCYTQQVLQLALQFFDWRNRVFLSSTRRGKDWPIYVHLPITCLRITAIRYDTAADRKCSLYLTATSVPLVRQRLLIMETRLWCELKQPGVFIWPPEKMEINVLWTLLRSSTHHLFLSFSLCSFVSFVCPRLAMNYESL